MLDFTCPACGYAKALDDRLSGRKWRCPSCNAKIKHRGGNWFQIREKGTLPDEPGDDQPEVSIDTARVPSAPPAHLTGSLLGHYRLLRLLGSGSGGHVFLGEHETLKRLYAVKLLPPGQPPEKVARLSQEAQSLAKVSHPNVVHVHDFGNENDTPYLVLQYVDGSTLSQALRSNGPFSNEQVLKLSRDLLAGLDAIHQAGLLHRDIKPSNIMLTSGGDALLADFGLAWEAPQGSGPPAPTFSGTADYAAPELALGQSPDVRSDLYALGGALYRAVTGRPPFGGDGATEKLKKQIYEPLTPARAWQPRLAPQLDVLLTKLLSKERDDRPASAKAALELLDAPLPEAAPPPPPPPPPAPPVEAEAPPGPPLKPILIASTAVVATIVAVVLASTKPAPEPAPVLPEPAPVVLPAPKPASPATPKADPLEKMDLEHLQQVIAAKPVGVAIQACAEFLDKYPKSAHAESVLLKKMELHQELDRLAGKTAPGKGLWTFRLKSGGRIQAPSYEELPDAYLVKIGGSSLRLSKDDVEEIAQEK